MCALHRRDSAARSGELFRSRARAPQPSRNLRSSKKARLPVDSNRRIWRPNNMNLYSYLRIGVHAIRACRTWAYKLARDLEGHGTVTYFRNDMNRKIFSKTVISRYFIANLNSVRSAIGRHCRQVNRLLLMPCVLRLAASQHRNFRTAPLPSIFISTMRPGQRLNRTTGDYQCCSRSSV